MYEDGGSFSVFANSTIFPLQFCSPFTSEVSNSGEIYYLPEALWLLPLALPGPCEGPGGAGGAFPDPSCGRFTTYPGSLPLTGRDSPVRRETGGLPAGSAPMPPHPTFPFSPAGSRADPQAPLTVQFALSHEAPGA